MTYIPFGAQYYRAPTPLPSQWEQDMKNIAAHGFNTVKLWAQWRWNNPAESAYDFTDLDRLMRLAAENGLRVIINTIFDAAPAWFYRKYPDSLMITSDDRTVHPRVTACRQAGGAPGPCYNHPAGIEARRAFLAETARRYAGHPALELWDLWNEPELTCGILRKAGQDSLVCYCPRCLEKFIGFLRRRFGDITSLNRRWNRNYACWNEVEPPRDRGTFNDMIDWRMFFSSVLSDELRMRVETIKAVGGTTPVMVHTVPMPTFDMATCCANDYEMAGLCDIFGNSVGNSPFPAALSVSCADGKKVINAEIHALGGDTYGRPILPDFEQMKGNILVPLGLGAKGFIFWQYRPETLGTESPAWGLTALDGSETQWLRDSARICAALQKNADFLNKAAPAPAKIAILNSLSGQLFDWCVRGTADLYSKSVIGAFLAFYHLNYPVDITEAESITPQRLGRYAAVYCPFPYYMDAAQAETLAGWVKDGGVLISEAFFGQVDAATGLHVYKTPGFGFSEIFGCREGNAITSAMFGDAYGKAWYAESADKRVPIDISGKIGGGRVFGYHFQAPLLPCGAEIAGTFGDGAPALTINSFGKGEAVYIGSLAGASYHDRQDAELRELLGRLVSRAGAAPPVKTGGGARIRFDMLSDDQGRALVVVNSFEDGDVNADIAISGKWPPDCLLIDIFTGDTVPAKAAGEGLSVRLTVPRRCHTAFLIQQR